MNAKTIVITGSSDGIGAAAAYTFMALVTLHWMNTTRSNEMPHEKENVLRRL